MVKKMNKDYYQYASTRRMAEINNAVIKAIVKFAKQEYPNNSIAHIIAVRHCAWCICAINMICLSNEDFSKSLIYLSGTDLISISETDEMVSVSSFASEVI